MSEQDSAASLVRSDAFLADVRNAAIEEAARLCEQTDENGENPDCWNWHAKDYARAIRELKANSPTCAKEQNDHH